MVEYFGNLIYEIKSFLKTFVFEQLIVNLLFGFNLGDCRQITWWHYK